MAKYLTSKNLARLKVGTVRGLWGLICAASATGYSYLAPMSVRPIIQGILFVLGFFSLKIEAENGGVKGVR